ncbi:hypothetical protein BDZ45DRAFT_690650 [Acephala macrosclerotiorum]|nr:hypothetical protein BDZ45DRAFT_690650 [Acephala macrosclerotiorum]
MNHISKILALLLPLSLLALRQNPPQYAIFFSPSAPIIHFQNTLLTPTNPQGTNTRAVWSGLQPSSGSFVYQTVIQSTPGAWWIAPQVCCTPQQILSPRIQLSPADTLKSTFELQSDGHVKVSWLGNPSGGTAFSGSAVMDPNAYRNGGPLNHAVFSIEPQSPASVWDFGNVVFKDIVVTAQTAGIGWCTP